MGGGRSGKGLCLHHGRGVYPSPYYIPIRGIGNDHGQQCQPFKSTALYKLYDKYRIKGNHSSRYYAPANGLAEAFNKTLCTILEKMVDKSKKTWPEKLPEALTEPRSNNNSSDAIFAGLRRRSCPPARNTAPLSKSSRS